VIVICSEAPSFCGWDEDLFRLCRRSDEIEPGISEASMNSEHGIVKKEPLQREKCENRKDCCFHLCDAM
jgi:hypothetical protein